MSNTSDGERKEEKRKRELELAKAKRNEAEADYFHRMYLEKIKSTFISINIFFSN